MRTLFLNKTYSRTQIKGLMEAILYVHGKPVSKDRLCDWFSISEDELEQVVNELNQSYEERSSGLVLIPVAGGYQLATNPMFKEEMRELFGSKDEGRLSETSMEILAIIAYKQPVTKEEIDKIRGVNSSRSLNVLLGMRLIDIMGNDDLLDEPLYGTTRQFLEIFRLKSLRDLPSPENLDFALLATSQQLDQTEGKELFGEEK